MDIQIFTDFSHSLQTIAAAALIFAVCALIPRLNYRAQLARLPLLGGPYSGEKQRQKYMASAQGIYDEGYTKFRDSAYLIASSDGDDRVVVPPSMLPELKKLHDDTVSFPKAIDLILQAKYTGIATDAKVVNQTIRSDLTPALYRLNEVLGSTVEETVREFMPACDDWTEVYVTDKMADIIAKVSGRIFVGPEIASDPEYLDCSVNYTLSLVASSREINKLRKWQRPFLAPRLPETRKLRDYEKKAADYIRPIIRGRIESKKNDPNYQEPDDMLTWLLNRMDLNANTDATVAIMVKWQLTLIMAAIHTTSATLTNILYTLAVTPEYVEPLREEMRDVLAEHKGHLSGKALQQLEKLDSYMKEVFRLYPPGITSFQRKVMKGITLSNGQHIPAGVTIEIPSGAMYTDPVNYPDADTFDGFRHYKLRRSASSTNHVSTQFVSTNETNVGFGYGRHACPGRFFAANEMKLILVRMVLGYDVKMPNDETTRYPQIKMGRSHFPNPKKTLSFKKVEV